MIITKIIPVTKQKYRIVTDEELAFVLYRGELSHYRLEEGQELPETVFRRIQEEILIKRAKLRAMYLLNRMDYTEAQMKKKLEQGEYTKEAVEIAMSYVRSFHYLDDQRYAERYLANYAGKKSRRQMEYELEQKGISKEIIAGCRQQAEEVEADETELIRSLLEKRCRDPKAADEKEKRRHYGYLVRKGFCAGDIRKVFDAFFEEL